MDMKKIIDNIKALLDPAKRAEAIANLKNCVESTVKQVSSNVDVIKEEKKKEEEKKEETKA